MSSGPIGVAFAQHGPFDQYGGMFYSFWILPAIVVVLVAVLLVYRLLFPSLTKVKPVEEVEQTAEGGSKAIVEEEQAPHVPQTREYVVLGNPEVRAETEALDKARVEAALQVLGGDERKVVQALIDNRGRILQREISWETGFSRVKTHRILVKLLRRNLVSAEKYYNTNQIVLADWLSKGMSPNDQAQSEDKVGEDLRRVD